MIAIRNLEMIEIDKPPPHPLGDRAVQFDLIADLNCDDYQSLSIDGCHSLSVISMDF
jgi:hypothetical protein